MDDPTGLTALQPAPQNPTADGPSTTVTGRATWFGLNPPDKNGNITEDSQDKPNSGAFINPATKTPWNSHDPNQAFASLPFSVFRAAVGNPYDAALHQAVSNGAYHVRVTANGQTKDLPIGDLGPAAWTGNALDLSGGAAMSMGLKDNTTASYNVIGPDGKPVQFKGNLNIDPNAPIEPGKTRGQYANDALQRYMKHTSQYAPGLKVMLPEEVAQVNDSLSKGAHLYDLTQADQVSYHLANDPGFLTKPENFPLFKELIWDKRPGLIQQATNAITNLPGAIKGAYDSAVAYGKSITNVPTWAATNAQGVGQGFKDAADILQSIVTNVSNLPRSLAAGLPGISQQSKEAVDLQNAQDAQALMQRSYTRANWAENMQQFAGQTYKTIGSLPLMPSGLQNYGNQVQAATPSPAAVDAAATVSNPLNFIPVGAGLDAAKALKPLFFERAIDATVIAQKADAAAVALRGSTGLADLQTPAMVANADANSIWKAVIANSQDGGNAASAMLQGAGDATAAMGKMAQTITSLPQTLAERFAPNNPLAQTKLSTLGDAGMMYAANHVIPGGGPAYAAVEAAGKVLPGLAKDLQIAGKEAAFGATTLPYLRRVAEQATGFTRFMAAALDKPAVYTLASATKGAVSGAAVGGIMGATGNPMPNLQTTLGGAVQGAVLGGAGGGLGQWIKYSSPGQFLLEAAGDLKRFKSTLTTPELQGFNRLSAADQGRLSQWGQHAPGVQTQFIHDPAAPSGWHEPTADGRSKIVINTASSTPLDGAIAHELLHTAVTSGNASDISDAVLGNPDKNIPAQYSQQEFAAMKKTYMDKLLANGQSVSHLTDHHIARELWAEQGVDYLKSGRGLVDAKSAFNPAVAANPAAMKHAMMKLGYTFDSEGNTIKGNSLFEHQGVNKDLYNLQKAYMQERQKYNLDYREDRVDRIYRPEDQKQSPAILEKLKATPEIARDAQGNVRRDRDGNILYISQSAVNKAYQGLGAEIKKQISFLPDSTRQAMGHSVEGDGTHHFNYLPDSVIQNLKDSGRYNSEQLKNLETINSARMNPAEHGSEMKFFYQAATQKGKYGSIAGADRYWTPYGFSITNKNNMLIKGVDFSKTADKYLQWQNKPWMKEAGFTSVSDFAAHTQQYFENHSKGLPGSTGLDSNPLKAEAKRDAINATLGLDTASWRDSNPLARPLPNRTGSFILTPRLDRINQLQKTDVLQPFKNDSQYGKISRNFLP